MEISKAEQRAICKVIELAEAHGYGNLMNHLATAWAKRLMDNYGMTEETARISAGGDAFPGYPFAMQEDLIKRGLWDESGKRYSTPNQPEPQP